MNYFLNLSKLNLTSGSEIPRNILSFVLVDYFNQKVSYNLSKSNF